MNLYYISQDIANGYDTYSAAVVAAKDAEDAKTIHPSSYEEDKWWERGPDLYGTWANHPSEVKAEYIGKAKPGTERGVILASFHAG